MNKLFFRLSLLFLVIGVGFVSCTKDKSAIIESDVVNNIALREAASETYRTSIGEVFLSDVENVNGVLKFIDWNHYKNVLEYLEYLVESNHVQFETQYSSLSASQLDEMELTVGFREWGPLEDFEESLNFNSRRIIVEQEIQDWLKTDSLLWATDPDAVDGLLEEERALITVNGEMIIGSEKIDILGCEGCPLNLRGGDDCWRFGRGKDELVYNFGEDKVKVRGYSSSYPHKARIFGKICHYEKDKKKGFVKARAELRIQAGGLIRDSDCNFPRGVGEGDFSDKKRKCRRASWVRWFPKVWIKFKDEETAATGSVSGVDASFLSVPIYD